MKGMEDNEKELLLQRFAEVNRKLKLAQEQLDIANKKIKEYEEKAQKAEKASKMKPDHRKQQPASGKSRQ